MFAPDLPIWELLARAGIVYVALLVFLRLSGKRTIGEFSPFDVLVMLLLSEAAQGALTGGDESVGGGLLVVATLIALNWLVAFVSARSRTAEKLIEGQPVVLIRDGRLVDGVLARNNLPEGEVDEAMRAAGIRRRSDVQLALLEPDGEISFFRHESGARGEAPA